jgi:hypothetical protein
MRLTMSVYWSIASLRPSDDSFRSSPGNGHRQARSPCLKGAISGPMHRSKQLFYHLVGAGEQHRRHGKAEGTGRPGR